MKITRLSTRASFYNWWPLPPILLVAVLFRIGDVPLPKGTLDFWANEIWIKQTLLYGLFGSYSGYRITYPPLHTTLMYIIGLIQTARGLPINASEHGLFLMLKLLPVICDLIIISVVYIWLRDRKLWRWIIPIWLAVFPGLIIISAWRGQIDSMVTMFNVCALVVLNRDRPRLAWMFWALALLSKLQGVLIGPLLFVLTVRRFGWRELAACLGLFGLVYIGPQIPFIMGSGNAYFQSLLPGVGGLTLHALNFWWLANPTSPEIPSQDVLIWGPLTARFAALAIVGTFGLLILVHAWRNSEKRYEFVWAASFELAVWVFLTQMFERYLYYAAALIPMAVAQEPQLWLVGFGVTYTFTLNNIRIWTGLGYSNLGDWLGQFLWFQKFYALAAALNVGMAFETLRILNPGKGLYKWVFQFARLATVATAITLILFIAHDTLSYYPTGKWLSDNVASASRIATENVQVTQYVNDLHPVDGSWDWRLTPRIETLSVSDWHAMGVPYIVVDESASPGEDFKARVNRFIDQGATLLYESASLLRLNSREAVLWTFHAQNKTNLIFDDSLYLIGYDFTQDGDHRTLLLYWYVKKPTPADFNVFIHLIDPTTRDLAGQADTALGGGNHPTSTWRLNEIAQEHYPLPDRKDGKQYILQVGLYQLTTGQRASIKDQAGNNLGSYFEITLE